MRPYKQRNYVLVSAGSYAWIPVDHHSGEFNVGYAAFHNGTGQVSANIDGTLDDVFTLSSCKAFSWSRRTLLLERFRMGTSPSL